MQELGRGWNTPAREISGPLLPQPGKREGKESIYKVIKETHMQMSILFYFHYSRQISDDKVFKKTYFLCYL